MRAFFIPAVTVRFISFYFMGILADCIRFFRLSGRPKTYCFEPPGGSFMQIKTLDILQPSDI